VGFGATLAGERLKIGLFLLASYLLGSVSFGYWIVRFAKGLDIRTLGSGNAGATNALRAAGKLPGLFTLLGDVLKGLLPVFVGRWLGVGETWAAAAGVAAVLGHVFPVFLGWRGGKGVATAGGAFLALATGPALLTFATFFVIVRFTRYVSLGSVVAALLFPVYWGLFGRLGWSLGPSRALFLLALGVAALIVVKHRGNLGRLWRGIERRLGESLENLRPGGVPVVKAPIGVVGAGSWGTALAVSWANAGCDVVLWARRPELADSLRRGEPNPYLPNVALPARVRPTADLADLAHCEPIVVVVASHGVRDTVRDLLRAVPARAAGSPLTLVSASKGVETETQERMTEVFTEEAAAVGRAVDTAVLSGPTFAEEVAKGVPSAAVVAAADHAVAERLQTRLAAPWLRLYTTEDVTGVELAGTAKNVIAIAAGVLTGLGLGHNTLAALITRGLHEITRLGVACGGDPRTFAGLAGLGDLVLTCTGGLSRNRRLGLALGKGKTLQEALAETIQVAEGVRNSLAIARLARAHDVEMPITEQMVQVLYEGKPARLALEDLMRRDLKREAEL
jgi:glycerol-3-phosphate dehydrogenase (NAD(P)+)